jgi:hypothetical protein
MLRAISLLVMLAMSLGAQPPAKDKFYELKLTNISWFFGYSYTVRNSIDAFTGASWWKLHVTEGKMVKVAIVGKSLYIIDEDGQIQETHYYLQAKIAPAFEGQK